jgi:beta-phosphoglucomutase
VLPLLKDIRKKGVQIALASPSQNAVFILEQLQLRTYFDAIIDGNTITKNKPDSEIFIRAAAAVNSSPKNCIVFENTVTGIEAAVSAGMRTVGVGEAKLLKDADIVIPDFEYITYSEIIEALGM